MQWFRHPSNFRNDPKLRAIEKTLGEAGYARAIKLFEIVAEYGSKSGKFSPAFNLTATCTDITWLAAELRISVEDTQTTLETFAAVELIDAEDWRNQVVRIPSMKNHLDEYTQRQLRTKKSRQSPERVPTNSGATPDNVPIVSGHTPDTAKSPEQTSVTQRKKDAAIASDLRLKEKGSWLLEACGDPTMRTNRVPTDLTGNLGEARRGRKAFLRHGAVHSGVRAGRRERARTGRVPPRMAKGCR
jgi:hypothetical protein